MMNFTGFKTIQNLPVGDHRFPPGVAITTGQDAWDPARRFVIVDFTTIEQLCAVIKWVYDNHSSQNFRMIQPVWRCYYEKKMDRKYLRVDFEMEYL